MASKSHEHDPDLVLPTRDPEPSEQAARVNVRPIARRRDFADGENQPTTKERGMYRSKWTSEDYYEKMKASQELIDAFVQFCYLTRRK